MKATRNNHRPPMAVFLSPNTEGEPMTTNDLHREVQEWRNRALLAESQLAVATRRPRAHNLPLTNAAGEIETPLPTTTAPEQE